MEFDAWVLVAGIGIFLFGIYLMEESLKALSGKAFKVFVRKYTSSPIKAVLSGTLSTAVLQSSSAVTLMILAFVGAGIMTLNNAFGVILGSNIGTTLTSWIVASIGFKLNIEALALPFIGIGGLVLIFFGRSSRTANISKLMVGFGFLFLGLDYMKTSVEALASLFDLSNFKDYNVLVFLLIGFAITAVMQSSSAAMAIVLTALYGDVITFYTASAMVIGTNLGTTITVLIGSFGGVIAKKQVAVGHVVFNVVTGILALLLLKPLNHLILESFNMKGEPLMALALFHTIFNVLGVLLFLPFTKTVAKFLGKVIKDKKVHASMYVYNATTEVGIAALEAIKNETTYLLRLAMVHNLKLLNIDAATVLSSKNLPSNFFTASPHGKQYVIIKQVQSETFIFSSKLQATELLEEEAIALNRALHAIRYSVSSAKTLKDVAHEFDHMEDSEAEIMGKKLQEFRKTIVDFYKDFDGILEKNDSVVNLPRLVKSMQKLKTEDHETIKSIGEAILSKHTHEDDVSSLLSAGRSFTLSLRQLALAVKELMLSSEESDIYDSLELSEEDLKNLYTEELKNKGG